jgi:PAS domain-containing protein
MSRISQDTFDQIFGDGKDSIHAVELRAQSALGKQACIVWEGDPETFQFIYVSPASEILLGYPPAAWLMANFWAEKIVHPEDRRDAIAYCALATGRGRDHDFVYRALKADGQTIRLHDVVKVILGPNKVPMKLRGIMIPLAESTLVSPIFERISEAAA